MPTDTPHGTRSLVAPSSRANDRPAERSSASSTAVSMTALDIQCPLNGSSAGPTAAPSTWSSEKSLGSMNRLSTSTVASTYSDEYSGSDMATHSPHPSACPSSPWPSGTARPAGWKSAAAQPRSASSLIPSHGNPVPATSVKARHPRPARDKRGQHVPQRGPPGPRPRGVGQPHRLDVGGHTDK